MAVALLCAVHRSNYNRPQFLPHLGSELCAASRHPAKRFVRNRNGSLPQCQTDRGS